MADGINTTRVASELKMPQKVESKKGKKKKSSLCTQLCRKGRRVFSFEVFITQKITIKNSRKCNVTGAVDGVANKTSN